MPTFIDESGDIGVKVGAKPFFRITAVWFSSEDEVAEYVERICRLREKTLHISPTFEFHFTEISPTHRNTFFAALADLHFRFAYGSTLKPTLPPSPEWTKEGIRKSTINNLLATLGPWYHRAEASKAGSRGLNERVFYDKCDDPDYEKALKQGFRVWSSQKGQTEKLIKAVNPVDSADTRIQIADMVGGAVNQYLDHNNTDLYKFLKGKEMRAGHV